MNTRLLKMIRKHNLNRTLLKRWCVQIRNLGPKWVLSPARLAEQSK
ncbi:MAG: hypothetical protein KGL39_47210 [Patescibacteria group bacterium]|nr:hypothetical protein [Patescibacteria group bacterium]